MGHTYDNKCPVGRSLNVIGDRWSILILRDLHLRQSCRFQELLESLEGVSPNTLSSRLKWLEKNGVVERFVYDEYPPRVEYLLTDKGKEFLPVLKALRQWGMRYKKPVPN